MKLALIKKTEKGTGSTWYHIELNDKIVDNTFTRDVVKAREFYNTVKDTVAKYPVDTVEIIETEDV